MSQFAVPSSLFHGYTGYFLGFGVEFDIDEVAVKLDVPLEQYAVLKSLAPGARPAYLATLVVGRQLGVEPEDNTDLHDIEPAWEELKIVPSFDDWRLYLREVYQGRALSGDLTLLQQKAAEQYKAAHGLAALGFNENDETAFDDSRQLDVADLHDRKYIASQIGHEMGAEINPANVDHFEHSAEIWVRLASLGPKTHTGHKRHAFSGTGADDKNEKDVIGLINLQNGLKVSYYPSYQLPPRAHAHAAYCKRTTCAQATCAVTARFRTRAPWLQQ